MWHVSCCCSRQFWLPRASSVGQTAVFPKILIFFLLCFSNSIPVFPTLSHETPEASQQPPTELNHCIWDSLAGYNQKEQVLSLTVYLYFEIKVLLDGEGISKVLLCNCFIAAVASQTEALRARKTNPCFWRKGNAKLRGLGTRARCDWTSYCTWTEPVNWPHIASLCEMKA